MNGQLDKKVEGADAVSEKDKELSTNKREQQEIVKNQRQKSMILKNN